LLWVVGFSTNQLLRAKIFLEKKPGRHYLYQSTA
jgi:hypothetical protein